MTPLVERSIFNPKTQKYFGFPDAWVRERAHYRADLWEPGGAGLRPVTWDDVLRAARR